MGLEVERGDIDLDKVSVVNELARALRCHPREILGTPNFATPAERANDAADDLVRHLRRRDLPLSSQLTGRCPTSKPTSKSSLHCAGKRKTRSSMPPRWRSSLSCTPRPQPQPARPRARLPAPDPRLQRGSQFHGLSHPHVIELATSRARWSAERSDDPLLPALADYMAARNA